jgi:hypothetical protein
MAYSKIGASPDGSSSYFLPRIIGIRRALELHYTNRALSAREAMEWGLVNPVHADADFRSHVNALARELAHGPTLAFGRAKMLFHQSTHESLATQMELESQAIAASGHTEDFKHAVVAFRRSSRRRSTVADGFVLHQRVDRSSGDGLTDVDDLVATLTAGDETHIAATYGERLRQNAQNRFVRPAFDGGLRHRHDQRWTTRAVPRPSDRVLARARFDANGDSHRSSLDSRRR